MDFVENLNHLHTVFFPLFWGAGRRRGAHWDCKQHLCNSSWGYDLICLLAGKTLIQVGCPYNCSAVMSSIGNI